MTIFGYKTVVQSCKVIRLVYWTKDGTGGPGWGTTRRITTRKKCGPTRAYKIKQTRPSTRCCPWPHFFEKSQYDSTRQSTINWAKLSLDMLDPSSSGTRACGLESCRKFHKCGRGMTRHKTSGLDVSRHMQAQGTWGQHGPTWPTTIFTISRSIFASFVV